MCIMKKIYPILIILLLTSCLNLLPTDTEEKDEDKKEQEDSGQDKGYKELTIEDKYSGSIIKIMDIPNGVSDIKIVGNKLYYSINHFLDEDPFGILGIMDITEPDNPKNLKMIGDTVGLSKNDISPASINIDNGYISVLLYTGGGSLVYNLADEKLINFVPTRIYEYVEEKTDEYIMSTIVKGKTYDSVVNGNRLYVSFETDKFSKNENVKIKHGLALYDLDSLPMYDIKYNTFDFPHVSINSVPPVWNPVHDQFHGATILEKDGNSLYMATIYDKVACIIKNDFNFISVPNGDYQSYNISDEDLINTGYDEIIDFKLTDKHLIVLYESYNKNTSPCGLLIYDKNTNQKINDFSIWKKAQSIVIDNNSIYVTAHSYGVEGGIMVFDMNDFDKYENYESEPRFIELGTISRNFDVKGDRAYVSLENEETGRPEIAIVKLN